MHTFLGLFCIFEFQEYLIVMQSLYFLGRFTLRFFKNIMGACSELFFHLHFQFQENSIFMPLLVFSLLVYSEFVILQYHAYEKIKIFSSLLVLVNSLTNTINEINYIIGSIFLISRKSRFIFFMNFRSFCILCFKITQFACHSIICYFLDW